MRETTWKWRFWATAQSQCNDLFVGTGPMAVDSRWYFTREQLRNSPSRKGGIEPEKELSYRQQAANLIQDMGQRLQVYPWFCECSFFSLSSWRHEFGMPIFTTCAWTILVLKTSKMLLSVFKTMFICVTNNLYILWYNFCKGYNAGNIIKRRFSLRYQIIICTGKLIQRTYVRQSWWCNVVVVMRK